MLCCNRALSYFRNDWKRIAFFLTLVGVSIGIGVMQAWPMAVLVDIVLNPSPAHPSWPQRLFLFALPHRRLSQIIGVTLIGMCMKIVQDLLGTIKILVGKKVTYNGRLRVRHALYAKLQHLNPAFHRALPQGDAIYRVLNDTGGCDQILNGLLNSSIAAVTLAAMVCIMLSRSFVLTLMAISVAPALLLANNYFGKRIKSASLSMKRADTGLTTCVQRGMTAIGVVQAFNQQRRGMKQFIGDAEASAATSYDLDWYNAVLGLVTCTIYSLGGAVIFGYGGYLVYRDQFAHPVSAGVTCGDLMVFMAYLGSIWEPLRVLAGTKADIQTGLAGAERVFEVLDRPNDIDDPLVAHTPFPLQARTLTLNQIEFQYKPEQVILRDISAAISPGELVAFIGRSGAGKSTLLQLLPRFADVTSGSVMLDGVDIRNLTLRDLRRHIAIVPQENTLLPGTISENIAFGNPSASAAEIRAAAIQSGADEFVAALPDGYATMITEGGQNFSGGQRQRIAIARALLTDAPILLLDEPTSALDPESAQRVLHVLETLRPHRTVILVTHDVASVANCDQIIVLDDGQIAERGTHEMLVAQGGLYVSLLNAMPEPIITSPYFPHAA